MSEQPAEKQPRGAAERRPVDVFNPEPDGVTPYTLEEVTDAAAAVCESLAGFQDALLGCMTPLALYGQASKAERMAAQATEWLETLSAVREIIECDLPLADSYPEDSGMDPEERDWTGPAHASRSLSPREVLRFNALAPEFPLERLTTYRREVEKGEKVPGLIRKRRYEAARAAEKAEELHLGPDATAEQRKAAANAKRARTRAAIKTARDREDRAEFRDRGPIIAKMFPAE